MDYFVDEIEEVRQKLGIDDFYLIGQSWGGAITQEYALKYPKHLKGIIISSMTDNIAEYIVNINKIREHEYSKEDLDFMKECENSGDYDNERYQKLIDKLNCGYVDRKQPHRNQPFDKHRRNFRLQLLPRRQRIRHHRCFGWLGHQKQDQKHFRADAHHLRRTRNDAA